MIARAGSFRSKIKTNANPQQKNPLVYLKAIICFVISIILAVLDDDDQVLLLLNRVLLLRKSIKGRHKVKLFQKTKFKKKVHSGAIVKSAHAKVPTNGPRPLQRMSLRIACFYHLLIY